MELVEIPMELVEMKVVPHHVVVDHQFVGWKSFAQEIDPSLD
jgi:hypothetical protein